MLIRSRVIPASRAGDRPFLAEHGVDQGRLAGVGTTDDGKRGGQPSRSSALVGLVGFALDMRAQRLEQIGEALAMLGGQSNRITQAELVGLALACRPASALLAATITGSIPRAASGRFPRRARQASRASIRSKAASASRTAASVGAHAPGRLVGSSSSKPAVSIPEGQVEQLASPSRRSRVTPGRSSTSATRRPTSRLNRVDLPTIGSADDGNGRQGHGARPCPPAPLRCGRRSAGPCPSRM